MPMQPSPRVETSSPLVPSWRFFMTPPSTRRPFYSGKPYGPPLRLSPVAPAAEQAPLPDDSHDRRRHHRLPLRGASLNQRRDVARQGGEAGVGELADRLPQVVVEQVRVEMTQVVGQTEGVGRDGLARSLL